MCRVSCFRHPAVRHFHVFGILPQRRGDLVRKYQGATGSALRLRAHRDELIALELELGPQLGLFSDGDLLKSPI